MTRAYQLARAIDLELGSTVARHALSWLREHGGGETVHAVARGLRGPANRAVERALVRLAEVGVVVANGRMWRCA